MVKVTSKVSEGTVNVLWQPGWCGDLVESG